MFELYCWYCGNDIEVKIANTSVVDNKLRVPVEPCQTCFKTEIDEARQKGYEEGQRNA